MNRLVRMVLVNSANVRYREVELDGHIHFIGTQGTGKSTLLRALLFFYNADSQRLGISKEKKTFVDYYFPFVDSYIFYEIESGERRYCVWLYKRQNRLCFRFLDGAYHQELTLKGQTARSEAEILAKAGERGIKVERIIRSFKEYRDILYGENRQMRRYALMQNVPSYATIPRTISNIFLNANLDGGYIKKTIIDSLSEDTVEINLETNRHHLDTARAHYADVMQYRRNEPKAEQIVLLYDAVLELEQRQRETAWKIGAAHNQAREQARDLESEMADRAAEKTQQAAKLTRIREQAETETRRIRDRLAVVKKDISTANEKKRHYEKLDIGKLLRMAKECPALEQELSHCTEQLRVLTIKTEQQEQQFKIAFQRMEYECDARVHQFREALSDAKDRSRDDHTAARLKLDQLSSVLEEEFEQQVGGYRKTHAVLTEELATLNAELSRLDHIPLFENQKVQLETRKRELEMQAVHTEASHKQIAESMEALRKEARIRIELLEAEGEKKTHPLTEQRTRQLELLKERQNELGALEGSFLEFLDEEMQDWKESIGRVVRRDVLLQSGLEPEKSKGHSLYGVDLKLEHLESEPLSKKQLLKEIDGLEAGLAELAKQIEKQLAENRDALAKLEQKFNRKIRELQDQGKKVEAETFSLGRELERNSLELDLLAEKEKKERIRRQAEVQDKVHRIRARTAEQEDLIDDLTRKKSENLERAEKDYQRQTKGNEKKLKQLEKETSQNIAAQQQQFGHQRSELEEQRKHALENAGVDAKQVEELETLSRELSDKISEIKQHERTRILYEQDKGDWIDRLPEFKEERSRLQNKLEHQNALFDQRLRQEQQVLDELARTLEKMREASRQLTGEIEAFNRFEREELFERFTAAIRHHDVSEGDSCIEQINLLKNLALEYQNKETRLRDRITAFSGLFSEGNCLGFETHLSGENSYRIFADTLSAFIRDQKLTTLQTEVTRKYSMVLETIVTETHRLLKREDEVHTIIQKINRDFSSSNFVGVVRSIEMKLLDSSNRIFQVLREICNFQAEHHMGFGEIDLFNQGDSGNDEKAVELLDELRVQMGQSKNTVLRLEDALDLEFRVCENENDTGWVSRLASVGSNGTDVLVKSMIYINLLNIFKSSSRKGGGASAHLHCLVDEVGILHDSNVSSLIQFAAERGICMINGSPNSHNEQDYRHIYIFRKEGNDTTITKLLSHAS